MLFHFMTPALVVFSFLSGAPRLDKDIDKLQGSWTVSSMEFKGKENPDAGQGDKKLRLAFDKDKMTMMGPPGAAAGSKKPEYPSFRLVLDESKTPKTVAIEVLNGPKKGEKGVGIYKIDGDDLWLCLPNNDSATTPPKDFKTDQESNHVLMKLKRAKEKKKE